jgi:hypothetical protein
MKRFFQSLSFLLTIPVTLLLWAALLYLPPASYYFKAESHYIEDTSVGKTIFMRVVRFIHRDFTGTYFTQVRQQQADGSWIVVCEGSGGGPYEEGSSLPDPLTLGWWAGKEECNTLQEPGMYRVATIWKVQTPLGVRTTQPLVSNIFVVTESLACRGYKVSSRGLIHGRDSPYFSVVSGPCLDTYEEAEEYANR